ncbi:MAG: oligosaccharyl transferase, archaeosortase A system-associated [Chloroflexi bacterium]|nr:oligosaccharyl transferase, archaeosortase A system-associated [Chloroflexota bacterium]
MSENRSRLVVGILVALFFGFGLWLRVVPPYDQIFVGDWIKFTGNDAYYFMRIVDHLVHNFPHLMPFDPYGLYPGTMGMGQMMFFQYFLAAVIWIVGLGAPTQHVVDMVGVYFPAVLGALTVIPVYFIGKALFSRWAGVLAAGLVVIFPGEFLGRSLLGFTDYHVAETLFTATAMMFVILAVKEGAGSGDIFDHLRNKRWGVLTKPLVYSLLAGIFLGIYFLTWQGALLFVLILFAFLVIQFIIDHSKGRPTGYLCVVSAVAFLVALLLSLLSSPGVMALASLVIAILVPIALAVLSRFMHVRDVKPLFYPVAVLGLGLVGLLVVRLVSPSIFQSMVGSLGIFRWPMGTTVHEMQPILYPGGNFSWLIVWLNFNTSFFLSFICMGILIYQIVKRGEAGKTLLFVWSFVMLLAMLSMRRFAYYYVVNAALLTGYLAWLVLEFAGFKKASAVPVAEVPRKAKKKAQRERQRKLGRSPAVMVVAAVVVLLVVFYPNIGPLPDGTKPALAVAENPQYEPSDAWCETLDWVRENTPEPFGNPDFYYELYKSSPAGEHYKYPESAYGVVAWWDYGYWVTRIGRRVPTSNPGTGQLGEAFLFAAQDVASASKIMDSAGSKYVIVDFPMVMPVGKFHAVATLSGGSMYDFFDIFYEVRGTQMVPVLLFYPEYYRSFVVRLYNFDGREVVPGSTTVVSYREMPGPGGVAYKVITSSQSFKTYGEALDNISARKGEKVKIVGNHPLVSPVPLEPLKDYRMVYRSKNSMMVGEKAVAEVKVFEYAGSKSLD